MTRPGSNVRFIAIAALFLIASTSGGTAQSPFWNFFDFFRPPPVRRAPAPPPHAYADPSQEFRDEPEEPRISRRSRAAAFCVPLCDGRYFPLADSNPRTAAHLCSSFCPAASTKVFTGPDIDRASDEDGSDYADLKTAYVYRERLVAGCTCNGKDVFGLARIPAADDPTLQTGDMLAAKDGLKVFHESSRRASNFTPVRNYSRLPKRVREKLATIPIGPEQ